MEKITNSRLRYLNPLNDLPDQWLFFGTFIVGAFAILALKYLGFTQWLVTIVPVALMGIYIVLAVVTKRYRLREDKVGDNVYYLGFLFTLVSLAYALYAYQTVTGGAAQIITNFGIAIATTIVGLAGRVFFNQMRQDPVEFEREARYSLAEAANELKHQLGDIVSEIDTFKTKVLQVIGETAEHASKETGRAVTSAAELLVKANADIAEKTQKAFAHFVDHAAQINLLGGKNAAALEALFRRIEAIEASPELITGKLEVVLAKFAETAEESAARNRALSADMKRIRETIEQSVAAGELVRKAINSSNGLLTEKMSAFGKGLQQSDDAAKKLAATLGKLDALATKEGKASQALVLKLRDLFEAESNQLEKSMVALRSAVVEIGKMVKETRAATQEALNAQTLIRASAVPAAPSADPAAPVVQDTGATPPPYSTPAA